MATAPRPRFEALPGEELDDISTGESELQTHRAQSVEAVREQGNTDALWFGEARSQGAIERINDPKFIDNLAAQYPELTREEVQTEYAYGVSRYGMDPTIAVRQPARRSDAATLLADAQLIQTELRDPATASEALESQAFSLQRQMNFEAAQAPSTMESAALRSAADGVETDELTAEERREELAEKAEVYAGLVARDYRTATDAAVEKFASGVRNGSSDIDLSQAYEVPAGVSVEAAESMARTRHESVGAALQPLMFEAETLGIHVRLGSASLAEAAQIQQVVSTPRRGIRV